MGGLTNGKDDETLVNQKFCPLEDRVVAIAEALDRVKKESGHVMIHAINVSTNGRPDTGGGGTGAGAGRLPAHGGRPHLRLRGRPGAGRGPVDQAADPCAPDDARGHDQEQGPRHLHEGVRRTGPHVRRRTRLHIGTFGVGKMKGTPKADLEYRDMSAVGPDMPYKRVMPVASGGVQPAMVPKIIAIAGNDVQIQAGGGVSGHPGGVRGGAKAMAQAVEAGYLGLHRGSSTPRTIWSCARHWRSGDRHEAQGQVRGRGHRGDHRPAARSMTLRSMALREQDRVKHRP